MSDSEDYKSKWKDIYIGILESYIYHTLNDEQKENNRKMSYEESTPFSLTDMKIKSLMNTIDEQNQIINDLMSEYEENLITIHETNSDAPLMQDYRIPLRCSLHLKKPSKIHLLGETVIMKFYEKSSESWGFSLYLNEAKEVTPELINALIERFFNQWAKTRIKKLSGALKND